MSTPVPVGRSVQATRVLAQVLVAGATVLFRAGTQAWQQALHNAQKSGVAQEAVKGAVGKVSSAMSLQEAQMILGVKATAGWEDVMKRYKHMFEVNEKQGSFYLQSKVYRARERLEEEYKSEGKYTEQPPVDSSTTDKDPKV
ncbi:MAG: hypothetical protein WDW36_007355 [Sanguina aurantia]